MAYPAATVAPTANSVVFTIKYSTPSITVTVTSAITFMAVVIVAIAASIVNLTNFIAPIMKFSTPFATSFTTSIAKLVTTTPVFHAKLDAA